METTICGLGGLGQYSVFFHNPEPSVSSFSAKRQLVLSFGCCLAQPKRWRCFRRFGAFPEVPNLRNTALGSIHRHPQMPVGLRFGLNGACKYCLSSRDVTIN